MTREKLDETIRKVPKYCRISMDFIGKYTRIEEDKIE
jgi:hypothetical protein